MLRSLEVFGGNAEFIKDDLGTGLISFFFLLDGLLKGLKIFLRVGVEMYASLLLGFLFNFLGSQFSKITGVFKDLYEGVFLESFIIIFLDFTYGCDSLLHELFLSEVVDIEVLYFRHMILGGGLFLLNRIIQESDSLSQLDQVDLNGFLGSLNIEGKLFVSVSLDGSIKGLENAQFVFEHLRGH